jgi:hypothetical protein
MNREGTIGVAALLAIAAGVGISIQPASRQGGFGGSQSRPAVARRSGNLLHKTTSCDDLRDYLQDFLDAEKEPLPTPCDLSAPPPPNAQSKADLRFVIATLPDPRHTHLSVSFDESTATIQEAAQDEGYDFDSSWLPWEQQEEQTYTHLNDQKQADQERDDQERQPGVLLFRKTVDKGEKVEAAATPTLPKTPNTPPTKGRQKNPTNESQPDPQKQTPFIASYQKGLVVFVVGEDATHGIHEHQFRNALEWIKILSAKGPGRIDRVMILGPTFSGSFPSLAELLSEPGIADPLHLLSTTDSRPLLIYSGGVSGRESAMWFQQRMDRRYGNTPPRVIFHSFVADDDEILDRFSNYIHEGQSGFDDGKLAILSEDETAYGNEPFLGRSRVLKLYYPRDISALRGAYQNKSIFDSAPSEESQNQQKRNLPTDLADPTGIVHDSVRSYAGNQTPLLQEAFLLQIVTALRERGVRYILLRGSNPLDQLFLTNFLRRLYPDARIVIVTSDLMFIRERGATGLSGVMTLSTYPHSSLARHWTERPPLQANDRVFSSDGSEGLYNALRLLINADPADQEPSKRCRLSDPTGALGETSLFLPLVSCSSAPIDDYAPPLWISPSSCEEKANILHCSYPEPAVWLSVIGMNRFWPLAPLVSHKVSLTESVPGGKNTPSQGLLAPPLVMKLCLLGLLGFAIFHFFCCAQGSYMAKPSFRAYFATSGDPRQITLIALGSSLVAYLGIVAAWSCGVFAAASVAMPYSWFAFFCLFVTGLLAGGACIVHNYRIDPPKPENTTTSQGNSTPTQPETSPANPPPSKTKSTPIYLRLREFPSTPVDRTLFAWLFPLLGILLFVCVFVVPLELALRPANRVLTYWRSMNLGSGLSPIVPFFSLFIGLYIAFWYALHGLAIFGPDRPRLPTADQLGFEIPEEKKPEEESTAAPCKQPPATIQTNQKQVLRMFSQNAADDIEFAAMPLTWARSQGGNPPETKTPLSVFLFLLFAVVSTLLAGGVPVRSLSHEYYAIVFLFWLLLTASLMLAICWRMYKTWGELRLLLEYLDRTPLRRTMEALRGFSWGSVWKMSGNVLEVRYKLISRQLESMNHNLASLEKLKSSKDSPVAPASVEAAINCLNGMSIVGHSFTRWYLQNYTDENARDLSAFETFQEYIAEVCGSLFKNLLAPAWRAEGQSLVLVEADAKEASRQVAPLAKEECVRNAEEFVCLTYMGFVQNILGRLRTMAISIVALFVSCCIAISSYPFDPRQALSAVLIALFVISSAAIVFVYAGMHRDATLSHVTNTTPGELGSEFWMKLVVFVLPPLLGLLARVFPGMTDFLFAWLQPGLSSLK